MSHDIGSLNLDDSDPEELFASRQQQKTPLDGSTSGRHSTSQTPSRSNYEQDNSRDEALRNELEKVKGVNEVIEKVVASLEKSRNNMSTVNNSVRSASTLLDTWTRILSQTEHNQRLLLNPEWRGATQDLEDLENESMLRQQAAERRAAEEEMRREAAARAAEEEERKRSATPSGTRGSRARGRGLSSATRGPSVRGGASSSSTARRTTSSARGGSGIGRGVSGTRGRARGS
ncbi:DASH complex subunit duo1-like protein [Elsinoe fawcettii]|nr:DASH complex subunit duo1-like protein [Elsinoe fawcettii]